MWCTERIVFESKSFVIGQMSCQNGKKPQKKILFMFGKKWYFCTCFTYQSWYTHYSHRHMGGDISWDPQPLIHTSSYPHSVPPQTSDCKNNGDITASFCSKMSILMILSCSEFLWPPAIYHHWYIHTFFTQVSMFHNEKGKVVRKKTGTCQ